MGCVVFRVVVFRVVVFRVTILDKRKGQRWDGTNLGSSCGSGLGSRFSSCLGSLARTVFFCGSGIFLCIGLAFRQINVSSLFPGRFLFLLVLLLVFHIYWCNKKYRGYPKGILRRSDFLRTSLNLETLI